MYFEDCPNWRTADERLMDLAEEFALDLRRTDVSLASPVDARFRGSPTILIEGRDPFPGGSPVSGVSCRIYRTPDGPAGSPTTDQLRTALRQAHP